MKTKSLGFIGLLLLLSGTSGFARIGVIAHRGYWDVAGSAQNSIAALEKAGELGVYGSEFDVSITADGVPVVNHDADIQGKCIETSRYDDIKNLKLANGETLPTLEAYLVRAGQLPDMQLILEIKPHKRIVNEDRAVAAVLDLVRKYGLEDRTEYITFSMNAGKELIRRAPGVKVAYLNGNVSPADLKALGFSGLDYHYEVFDKHPDWIREAHEAGLTVNVWTVDDPETMKSLINRKVDYITTNKPLELKALLKQ